MKCVFNLYLNLLQDDVYDATNKDPIHTHFYDWYNNIFMWYILWKYIRFLVVKISKTKLDDFYH